MIPEFIDSHEALGELVDELKSEDCVAVDTEFARERTYYPHIGLIQLASKSRIACIDPLAFDTRARLAEILYDKSITKVFHACLQDLEVLDLTMGAVPCPLFDTQVATALMNEDHQISYARLVENELDIKLTKSETRTDWLKRPLTAAQLEYAADDVRFLLQLHSQQVDELAALNRSDWMREECDRLCSIEPNSTDDLTHCWTRIKGKERLRGIELAVLQQAALWRERQAMVRDRTRRRILPDDHMIQIARNQPKNVSALARIGRISKLLGMPDLDSLCDAISTAYQMPESEWPALKRRQLSPEQSAALAAVLDLIRKHAAELGISPGMLCNRKDAEKLVIGQRDLPVLSGWRRDYIGNDLLKTLPECM